MKTLTFALAHILLWFSNLFHIHSWYRGHYSLGVRSKYSGDLIGRSERQCVNCDAKELAIHCLSNETKNEIYTIFGRKTWYRYVPGDELDNYTRSKLTRNAADHWKTALDAAPVVNEEEQYKELDPMYENFI